MKLLFLNEEYIKIFNINIFKYIKIDFIRYSCLKNLGQLFIFLEVMIIDDYLN